MKKGPKSTTDDSHSPFPFTGFDIKIIKGRDKSVHSTIYLGNCIIHIRKPEKIIDDYIQFLIEIVNHEVMHFLLFFELNHDISTKYDNICHEVEDRKLFVGRISEYFYEC